MYKEIVTDERIGRYRFMDFDLLLDAFDTFTEEQRSAFVSRSFINNKDKWEELFIEYEAKDIVAELKERNKGKPEDVLTEFLNKNK